jgi:hypothetical protein
LSRALGTRWEHELVQTRRGQGTSRLGRHREIDEPTGKASDPGPPAERSSAAGRATVARVSNVAGDLTMGVLIDGRPTLTDSRYAWSGGGLVLTITTVLPDVGLAFELISTYIGHHDTDTIAAHLTLGEGQEAQIQTSRHRHDELNPVELARACAYDHVSRLISALADRSLAAQVDLDEHTFHELERVE